MVSKPSWLPECGRYARTSPRHKARARTQRRRLSHRRRKCHHLRHLARHPPLRNLWHAALRGIRRLLRLNSIHRQQHHWPLRDDRALLWSSLWRRCLGLNHRNQRPRKVRPRRLLYPGRRVRPRCLLCLGRGVWPRRLLYPGRRVRLRCLL